MKKTLVMTLAVSMLFGTAAQCASLTEISTAKTKSDDAIELVLWHNRGGANGETVDGLIDEFNETVGAQKGIKVTSVRQDDSIVSTFKTLLYANDMANMPDLATLYAGDVEYASTVDCIQPLDDLMANDSEFNSDDILPSLRSAYNYMGTQYSLPFHGDATIMYYNKTAFEAAGLDPSSPPTTIAEMAEAAEKLLVKDGETVKQYAITLGMQNCYFNNWIADQGDVFYLGDNEAGRTGRMTKVTFDTDGTMLNLLNEWQKVLDTDAVQSIDEGDQPKNEFISGLSAMFIGGNWAMTSIEEGAAENGFEVGVCELPKVKESDIGGVCPGGTSMYIINKDDDTRVQAAWEFMKWWTSGDTQTKFCMKTKYIPVNSKTLENEEYHKWLEENPNYKVPFDALMNSDPRIQEQLAPTQQEFQSIFLETCQSWAKGEMTAEECVQNMAEKCNAALDEYNTANPIE
ncbi:MAG: ABC transporter substrate-binding protein [Lachnospiraceae bacterium]|nr:ABC transporter substrate-binding protein [Lachnospiraceae bacterium]